MSMHTPGPWKVREIPEGMFACKSWTVDFSDDEEQVVDHVYVEADAHLIAAAPDLLGALESLFASYKELADSGDAGFWAIEDKPEGKQAIAAIAKARGQA